MTPIYRLLILILVTCHAHAAVLEKESAEFYQHHYSSQPQNYIHAYNLGSYYLDQNQIGYAITYLEKSLKLAPRDPDTHQNLRIAKQKVIDPLHSKRTIVDLFQALLALVTVQEWLLLLTGSQAILVILNLIRRRFITVQKTLFLLIGLPTLAALVLSLEQHVVVVIPRAELKQSPSQAVDTSFHAHEGVKATILEEHLDWVKIKCQNGITGWIEKKALEKI